MARLIQGVNDFETWCITNNKDMLNEWDFEKNEKNPSEICYGSGKKYWWICPVCKSSYEASLNKRTSDGTACPYCCKSHAKLLVGVNDLETTNPELLSIWNYEKNGDLLPRNVMKGQHKKVWWKCNAGHDFLADLYHISGGRGCPICRKESQTSFQEQAILYYIRQCFKDSVSSNRTILDGKELDIFIPSINTAIEFDGGPWHKNVKQDELKNKLCYDKGITLIRIRDTDCPKLTAMNNVIIIDHNEYSDDCIERCIKQLFMYLRIEINIDINKDKSDIYTQYIKSKKDNSLSSIFPEISKEWCYEKNKTLTPDNVSSRSAKKVWWKCSQGHIWQAAICSRTGGHGCPYCNSNRLLQGYNDLETLYPDIINYWDTEKNKCSPKDFTTNVQNSFWWKCKCGHSYRMALKSFLKSKNICPICNPKNNSYRYNKMQGISLKDSNPELVKEWDFDKNIVSIEDVTSGSSKKVWWKCKYGHSYQSTISNHVKGKKCPYCSGHKVLEGFNDVATVKKEVLPFWDYEKNEIRPNQLTANSGAKIWWKCVNGHSFKSYLYNYKAGSCPYCAGKNQKIINLDTGEIFNGYSSAARSCGLKSGDPISFCCKGKQKVAGGYHWKYYNEDNNKK